MEQPEPTVPDVLEWRVWPAGDRPLVSVIVALFVLGFCVTASWSLEAMSYGVVGLVILFLVLSQHYLPAYYRLDATGVTVRGWSTRATRAWSEVPYAWDFGVMVALTTVPPSSKRLRRDAILLRLNDNHDEVVAFLRKHVNVIDKRVEKGRQRWPR